MQGNTPDFIFTYFIELFCDVTAGAPRDWELESTVMAIQETTLRVILVRKINPAMEFQSFNNYWQWYIVINCSYKLHKIDSEGAQPLASSENITRELRMASSV